MSTSLTLRRLRIARSSRPILGSRICWSAQTFTCDWTPRLSVRCNANGLEERLSLKWIAQRLSRCFHTCKAGTSNGKTRSWL